MNDSRWLEFRAWLLGEAPAWLRLSYIKHGAAFAKWIANKPAIKRMLKRLMDRAIQK